MSVDEASTPAIRIDGAHKRYGRNAGGLEAVSDVSLEVTRGSIHGLLGPNGAGKTTTLKMLLGLVRPSDGVFEILGEPAGPAVRARVGFLPEQPYFPPLLTGEELLSMHGRLSGMEPAALSERIGELLSCVGLDGRARTRLADYSRGMLQRIGIAQALIARPEVVVLDEPASGLDPVGQRDVRNLMLLLAEEQTTVLLSSHQLSEVEAVCDEVTILNRGHVAAKGAIDDLLNVAGKTSVRVRGADGALPSTVEPLVEEVAVSGSVWVFSVPEKAVRAVVDALDDAGWTVESLTPKRASLEEYFAGLLSASEEARSEEAAEEVAGR